MQFFIIVPKPMSQTEFVTYRDYCYDSKQGVTMKLREFDNMRQNTYRGREAYHANRFENGIVRCLDVIHPENGFIDVGFNDWLQKGPGYQRARTLEREARLRQ